MSFIIDKQTLDDLNIFGKRGKDSIYALFNRTATRGGSEQLDAWFRNPLSDEMIIQKRIDIISFFKDQQTLFPFKNELFEAIGLYLNLSEERSGLSHNSHPIERKIKQWTGSDMDYRLIKKGIISLVQLLQHLNTWVLNIQQQLPPKHTLTQEISSIQTLLNIPELERVFTPEALKPSFSSLILLDKLLRYRFKAKVGQMLQHIYMLDVYIAIAQVAVKQSFVFPELAAKDAHTLSLLNCWHPELKKPVPNSIVMDPDRNIIFLTGANMAGKSTFMKSVGIAIFLAHMGFPVPAEKMIFSVRDGLLTTINLPDNLDMGYSHFYVEVLRVKKVANLLKQGKNMFIMFDELFRGTNVKDAYEATIAITGGFAQKRNCMFIVSTHIMEAGEILKEQYQNINFLFLPTKLEGSMPVYTRRLESGITADRHGMIIIHNEGILSMLEQ